MSLRLPFPSRRALIIGAAVAYGAHFLRLWYYAVDLPFWDEWRFLDAARPSHLGAPFLDFIADPLFDSRIVWTMAQIYASWRFDGWNNISLVLVNFSLFGLLLIWITHLAGRAFPATDPRARIVLVFPLLTPWFWEAHAWPIQSCTLASTFFFSAAVWAAFRDRQTPRMLAVAALCAAATTMSWGRGAAYSVVFLGLWSVWKLWRREFLGWFVVVVSAASALALYFGFWGWSRLLSDPAALSLPNSRGFWRFLQALLPSPFGFASQNHAIEAIAGVLLVGPFTLSALRFAATRTLPSVREWRLATLSAAALAALAATAVARGYLPTSTAASSRYAYANGLMLPFLLLYYADHAQARVIGARAFGIAACLFAAAGYLSTAFFDEYATYYRNAKTEGLQCLKVAIAAAAPPPWKCDGIAFTELKGAWELAGELDLSFHRKLTAGESLNSALFELLKKKPDVGPN